MADDQTIRVQRPDGKFSTIPLSSFPIAKAKGYQLAPPKFSPQKPTTPSELSRPEGIAEFPGKVLDRIGQNFQGMAEMPRSLLKDSRTEYLSKHPEGSQSLSDKFSPRSLMDALSAMSGSTLNQAGGAVKGLAGVTAPGVAYRMSKGEKPENLAGDAAMFFMPGGEEGAARTYKPVDLTKPGSLWGAKTRAVQAYQMIDKAVGDVPVDHSPAMEWAQKAVELGKRGFKVPKPITDFIAWVEQPKSPLESVIGQGGGKVDVGRSISPVTYRVARDFKTAIREAVPWEEFGGKNGKMFRLAKEMEKSLDKSTVEAVRPYGFDTPLRRADAEYAKAMKARSRAFGFGLVGGKIAGYGAGSVVGHPLLLGYGGSKAGESLAGSMVRSITERGSE